MTTEYKRVINGDVMGLTPSVGYTAPASTQLVIHRVAMTNINPAANAVVSVYLVPSGETALDRYKIASDAPVVNDKTVILYAAEGQVLEAGGTIQYESNTPDCVTVIASGIEISA